MSITTAAVIAIGAPLVFIALGTASAIRDAVRGGEGAQLAGEAWAALKRWLGWLFVVGCFGLTAALIFTAPPMGIMVCMIAIALSRLLWVRGA